MQSSPTIQNIPQRKVRHPAWQGVVFLHGFLLVLTFATTTSFGYAIAESFRRNTPFDLDHLFDGYILLAHLDGRVWEGLSFSLPLLAILSAHELGHYLACRFWKVDASLPYFLPSPLLLGTFGAFIRIRSPIYSRRSLFDIGASGPFAGMVILIPFLIFGVSMSHVSHAAISANAVTFGTPLLFRFIEWVRFGNTAVQNIALHPMAMAAWTGLLATAMNLLPMGQLDGGHIAYSALGEWWHRNIATAFVVVLIFFGFTYKAWWFWAVVMFLLGRRHPLVYDQTPLEGVRIKLSVVAVALLVLSLAVVPVSTP